jgi:tetratricopeptide (TPR) repeat protein
MLAYSTIALLSLRQSEPAALVEGQRLDVDLRAQDPILEKHGHSRHCTFRSTDRSLVCIWARSDTIDPFLRIEDAAGGVLGEDEDSGGCKAAFVTIEAKAGQELNIHVATHTPGEVGKLQLAVFELPHIRDADVPALEGAKRDIADSRNLWKSGRPDEARGKIAGAVSALLALRDGCAGPNPPPEITDALWSAGSAAHDLGALEEARGARSAVLDVREHVLPDEHPNLQRARANLALTIQLLGDLQEARELEEKVLEVREQTLTGDHPDLQRARGNLAGTLAVLGDLPRARELFEQMHESMRNRPDDDPDLLTLRKNLGALLQLLGDWKQSRVLLEKVLEVRARTLPPDHLDVQIVRDSLATALANLGDLQGARALEESVLEAMVRTLPPEHPDRQAAAQNLANTSRALGDLQGARALEEGVLAIRSRTLPDDHPELQMARANLAITLYSLGDSGAGGELARAYARAIGKGARESMLDAGPREAEERCSNLRSSVSLALSFAAGFGTCAADAGLDREAFAASEQTRGAAVVSSVLVRAARTNLRYEPLRVKLREASGELARMLQAGTAPAELSAVRVRREALEHELCKIAEEQGAAGGLDFDVGRLAHTLGASDAVVAYRRYTRTGVESGSYKASESLCAFILRADGRLERVELGPLTQIEKAVRGWRCSIGVEDGTRSAARGDARPSREEERGVAGAVTPATGEEHAGNELRQLLFDPLRRALQGVSRIIACPDDVVNLVALDALPAAMDGERGGLLLGDTLRIETRTTLLELLLEERGSESGGLVALGDPTFDRPADSERERVRPGLTGVEEGTEVTDPRQGESMPPPRSAQDSGILRGGAWEGGFGELPGTHAEVMEIGQHYGERFGERAERHVLEREAASRENLIALAPRARFLHLATHGWFAPDSFRSWGDGEPTETDALWPSMGARAHVRGMNPMLLCGLALAGANLPAGPTRRIRGLVTAEELSTLELSTCELAVLSACDTSVGLRRAGQGVASLQRALQMAGARSVITSLWKVPDEATRQLMADFYRRVWIDKAPKAEALWEAKRGLRSAQDEAGKPRYSPRDWAAWVLTGAAD